MMKKMNRRQFILLKWLIDAFKDGYKEKKSK